MRRTKAWWRRLTKNERRHLVFLEASHKGGSAGIYMPEDCSECPACGQGVLGRGWCTYCSNMWASLVAKASMPHEEPRPAFIGNAEREYPGEFLSVAASADARCRANLAVALRQWEEKEKGR